MDALSSVFSAIWRRNPFKNSKSKSCLEEFPFEDKGKKTHDSTEPEINKQEEHELGSGS